MDLDYLKKYEKYEIKYLSLKNINQYGGNKEEIMSKINEVYGYYSSSLDITPQKRLEMFNTGFNEIVDLCKQQFEGKANEYYTIRNKENKKYKIAQKQALKELKKVFHLQEVKDKFKYVDAILVHKTSSYAAKTHVLGESDIDFTICIDSKLNISDFETCYKEIGETILTKVVYTYKRCMHNTKENELYQVFTKMIDGIEIEVKIRDLNAFSSLLRFHEYMNSCWNNDKKIYITYIKYLLSNPKVDEYTKFKWLIMEFGFYNAGVGNFFGQIDLNLKTK